MYMPPKGTSRPRANLLVLPGVGLGDLLDHEHPGVAVVLDLVPAAVLDGLPVEGPRNVRLGVAPHVADEAHVAVQDLTGKYHSWRTILQNKSDTGWSDRI